MKVKAHYKYLVGVVVDKSPGRILYTCPEFYEKRYYNPTFPVRSDPVKYRATGTDSKTILDEKKELFLQRWCHLATYCPDGRVAVPYVLPKVKDIIAKCDDVVKKKGTCCRARPIVPCTFDPRRRLYKKVGKILLYIENKIPRSHCAIVSNCAQVVRSVATGVDRALAHYKHTNFRWCVMVGDVANMYDELGHKSVDTAMDWLLDNSPTWLNRIARVNMCFSVTPWGTVTQGTSCGENKDVWV